MKRQQGFGLIEVMIAFIVVAITAGSLLQLNKSYLEYSRDGRNREVALRLAESKLDELRYFRNLQGYQNITGGTQSTALNGVTYALGWTVNDVGWDVANTQWVTPLPTGVVSGKKEIAVTIDWNDTGSPQSFTLTSVISPNQSISGGPFGSSGEHARLGLGGPDVLHTPGSFPDVIPIELGDGLIQETSKSVITVANDASSIRVSEKTVTYDEAKIKQQQQELETVSCTCKLISNDDADLPAKRVPLGQFSFWQRGGSESKKRGEPLDNKQDPLCDLCCKNHFDGSKIDFSHWYDAIKWRNAEKINGQHAHYNGPSGGAVENVASRYLEACRFIRVDGFMKVANDWNLVVVNVFPENFLSDNKEKYQEYVKNVVIRYIQYQVKDGDGFNVNSYAMPGSFYNYPGVDKEVKVNSATSTSLVARGVYVDIISPSYRESLLSRMVDGENTSIDKLLESGFIKLLPFDERKLNAQVKWSIGHNEAAASIETGGVLRADAEGKATITAEILRSNSGLTTNKPISPFEQDNPVTATLDVHISSSLP